MKVKVHRVRNLFRPKYTTLLALIKLFSYFRICILIAFSVAVKSESKVYITHPAPCSNLF